MPSGARAECIFARPKGRAEQDAERVSVGASGASKIEQVGIIRSWYCEACGLVALRPEKRRLYREPHFGYTCRIDNPPRSGG